ncbi:hypothetical protein [Actinoplanes sichuanensis]|uniref:Uncharacterized protein n=1 Tax=Actinoplanes sichuanensis TaxID=512349 RepID=A0ABW4AI09_9ACTN|nr:hypothetical protein [Actinoplanes sichuanensis]
MRQRAGLILGVVVLLAGIAAVAGWRWWQGRAPYGPEALRASATLRLVDQATADAALEPAGAEIPTGDDDQILLGTVSWTAPQSPQGTSLRIVLLDKRRHLLPGFLTAKAPDPQSIGTGMDGSLDLAQQRYDWLAATATSENAGSMITVSSTQASPVTFQTVLHPARPDTPPEHRVATAPVTTDDMLVALICVGADGRVHWAQRLLN